MRTPLPGKKDYGFRDSINLLSNLMDDRYLALDQSMLFISIYNYLENSEIRKRFAKDPLVANGISRLGDRLKPNPELLEKWAKRDASEPEPVPATDNSTSLYHIDFTKPENIVISTFSYGDKANLTQSQTEEGLVIDFDLGTEKQR